MKRALALALSFMLLLTVAFAQGEQDAVSSLVVGSVTRMSGDFFAGLWSNNTSDNDVRTLLHDAKTVAWMENGNYAFNENVMADVQVGDHVDTGDRTYTFTIRDDMKFSDGTPITASDYVFSVLLLSSKEIAEIGALNRNYMYLQGWDQFSADGSAFTGVRLLDNERFSLTIQGQFLPYFYELSMVDVTPYPMHVLAPECQVKDDGEGAYLAGTFTADVLKSTILDETNGYLSHPSVVSGPYVLTSYDQSAGIAEFDMNPCYMGNFEGQMPTIAHLTLKEVNNQEIIPALQNGEIDLVNKVSSGDVIVNGSEKFAQGLLGQSYYLRSGLSFIAFACERRFPSSAYVRKAVALSLDQRALCDDYLKGNGQPVFGYYGYGQWMAAQQTEALDMLDLYEPDRGAAIDMLVRDGWVYNENGTRFEEGTDQQRYRALDANGNPSLSEETAVHISKGGAYDNPNLIVSFEPLTLRLAIAENSDAASYTADALQQSLQAIGIQLEVTRLPADELFRQYYRQEEREWDMMFMATNFGHVFDPYTTFNIDDDYQGVSNTTGIRDAKLMQLADKMRRVSPDDLETYKQKWLDFQTYFAEVIPMAPLYSNVYFDFYRPDLNNYSINAYSSWADAILYVTVGEETEEPADFMEAPDEDMIIIE